MEIRNALEPTPQQVEAFLGSEEQGTIYMINLLKFKERAVYADGRECDLSGRDAYAIYGAGVVETLADVGGRVVFAGRASGLLIGEMDELWDEIAIAEYPSPAAMIEMIGSEKYQAIHVHRDAGLAGQMNITTRGLLL